MSSLDNMTARIIREAEERANQIINDAKKEEAKIINEKINDANIKKEEILKKAELESISKKERVISNAHLQVRNKKLETKQEVIEKIYKEALEKLSRLNENKYLDFIKNSLLSLSIDGDEKIILSNMEALIDNDFINKINEELIKKGKTGAIKISEERRDFKGGFILYKNGIEINNTFEALILSVKDELEPSIIETVFG
ncbi:V-type ATP synthase subunit E [Clostridium sp. MSJ-11]|uniref:V-type proton ATPase subunit E n=1 Tax=Clostridium mobile TaxID=2841512 RepID=A0ABS6EI12_9CLOT|nr:V-type ATP synthase subunit E family protein [Clostridium mobile]MBU5484889.1 V-type ATP synthase subunit E [Clostridium mobile]